MKAHLLSISSFDVRGRKALRALGWALLLAVAVDLACRALLPSGFLLRIEALTRQRVAQTVAPDVDIVGDSVARSGFLASGISDGQFTARNIALPASGPVISYYLLREAFEAGHVPKALVIAHSPHNFSQFRYAVLMGGFAHWHELPEMIADYGQWRNSLYAVLTRFSYLLMHRDSFELLLRDRDFSFFREKDSEVEVLSDRSELSNFRRELPLGLYDQSRLVGAVPDFYAQPFTVLDINDRYFRRLLSMARSYGVQVYWFTMPTPAGVLAARARVNYERDLVSYLQQFERTGELKILRAEFVVYDDTLFRDWLHLNLKGAVKLSCELRDLRKTIFADKPAAAPATIRAADPDDPQAVLDHYCGMGLM